MRRLLFGLMPERVFGYSGQCEDVSCSVVWKLVLSNDVNGSEIMWARPAFCIVKEGVPKCQGPALGRPNLHLEDCLPMRQMSMKDDGYTR
jgi:hypothetical protein